MVSKSAKKKQLALQQEQQQHEDNSRDSSAPNALDHDVQQQQQQDEVITNEAQEIAELERMWAAASVAANKGKKGRKGSGSGANENVISEDIVCDKNEQKSDSQQNQGAVESSNVTQEKSENDKVSSSASEKKKNKKKKKKTTDTAPNDNSKPGDTIDKTITIEGNIENNSEQNSVENSKATNSSDQNKTEKAGAKKQAPKLSKTALLLQKRQAAERERQRLEEEKKAEEEMRLKRLQEEQELKEKQMQQQKAEKKIKDKENKRLQKVEEERQSLLEKKERFANQKTIIATPKSAEKQVDIVDNTEIYSIDDISRLSGLKIDRSLRSPVVCVLGHVDTGKTKMLDQLRCTKVQDNEAGGITQQIGATNVTAINIQDSIQHVKFGKNKMLKLPGILLIDTPGHESFSNLRARGTSLCDIAILIVDINHGLENQTIESIELLKNSKTPFIIALNKIDMIYGWKSHKNLEIYDVIEKQDAGTKSEFDDLFSTVFTQFAEKNLNVSLFYDQSRMASSKDMIPIVPTSAVTGEGVADLMSLVCQISQFGLKNRLKFSSGSVEAFLMEAKRIQGYGMTLDVILVNGEMHEGDTIIIVQNFELIVAKIKFLLVPPTMAEVRVKVPLKNVPSISGTRAIKITLQNVSIEDNIQIGLPLPCCTNPSEEKLEEMKKMLNVRSQIDSLQGVSDKGVHVQASTIGSLEALISFLKSAKIQYSSLNIGDVYKKDILKASAMLESSPMHAAILAFDVKIDRDASELASQIGVKIFSANIIYHLYDQFTKYVLEYREMKKKENWQKAIFPCVLRILPEYMFNKSDPLVCGVAVESGEIHTNTKLRVFTEKDNFSIGIITSIEMEKKAITKAVKGDEVSIKVVGDAHQKIYGRHYNSGCRLISDINRESIDVLKEYFRDEMSKEYWLLVKQLKMKLEIE